MSKTYVRQNSHSRSISLPCGPVCMEKEYNKLMGHDQDEPSSPTSETLTEEEGLNQTPPSRRCRVLVVTSMMLIFVAVCMSKYSEDGFWLTAKKRFFMYQ